MMVQSNRRASLFDTSVLGRLNLVLPWWNDLADPAAKTLLCNARVLLREVLDPSRQQSNAFVACWNQARLPWSERGAVGWICFCFLLNAFKEIR